MPFKSEKQRKWMWANEPEMAKKWEEEEEEQNETLSLNPNVNVPGMGAVSSPGDPGTLNQFATQDTGSGDFPFPISDEEEDEDDKKKKLKYIKNFKDYGNS